MRHKVKAQKSRKPQRAGVHPCKFIPRYPIQFGIVRQPMKSLEKNLKFQVEQTCLKKVMACLSLSLHERAIACVPQQAGKFLNPIWPRGISHLMDTKIGLVQSAKFQSLPPGYDHDLPQCACQVYQKAMDSCGSAMEHAGKQPCTASRCMTKCGA